ncbi:hypothetical protein BDW42DRAFT_160435 [Aspergillus taichungensis]|uniref:FAD-binding PCMH-type domain-containing protein n=1 Tax=Aspergillus taichungensis TaxID=482145 RepID=A0A2J5I6V2_9EURO|nr:hypothetical protein BDW42DRAFT_160435 [Aspergillus taichungensis]
MHHTLLLLGILSVRAFSQLIPFGQVESDAQCRCRPNDPCWPSLADWNTLNSSIHGNLVRVRPVGYVCHEPTYDKTACDYVSAMSPSGAWRAGEPGALENTAWEVSIPTNETCYVGDGSNPSEPCNQGRIPLYSAVVRSTEDTQAAVRFAKDRNLRLTIKNTGHDAGGRSSAVDSFQILTQGLKDIKITDNFVPKTASAKAQSEGPAVTFGAGVLGMDLYAAAAGHGYNVVAGECSTIGVAGGFLQGGGVSTVLAPLRGLSADLALEFEVVTADGNVVVANQYQNADLFWALRGGGGGTFGVVTSVTMRVFEDIPAVVSTLSFEMTDRDQTYWAATREVVYKARDLSTGGNSAQYSIGRKSSGNPYVKLSMFTLNVADKKVVNEAFAPLLTSLTEMGVSYDFSSDPYPRLSSYLKIPQEEYSKGLGYYQDSVLVPNELYESEDGPRMILEQLATIDLKPDDVWVVNTLGGQVNANKHVDNALHKGWRSAAVLLVGNRLFGPSLHEQQAVQKRITNVEGPVLYSLKPSPVAMYLNEADPHLENWQEWFWGDKYARLRDIKRKWDPDSLFIVSLGVGSEEWVADGMCRRKRQHQGIFGRFSQHFPNLMAFFGDDTPEL